MRKRVLLIITDGIGYSPRKEDNAFESANKKAYDYLFKNVPYSLIKTYGLSVGLPDGQMGNSEVGHMTIGSGRVLYQDLVKISLALKNGSIEQNEVLNETINKSGDIHLIGLLSDGGVHSHIEHIIGLAKLISNRNKKVFIHAITDGRDVSPTSSPIYLEQLQTILNENIILASISGRYYSMDRDKRWERIKRGYDAIVNAFSFCEQSPIDYVKSQYEKNITDEFLEPVSFVQKSCLKENDGVIFCNFRSDRMRQLVSAFGDKNFKEFETKKLNLNIATMTEYAPDFTYPIMFAKENPTNTLAEVISKANLRQLHTAETEKYAHVTFFFNGGIEEPYENETRVLIPSPKVATYDLKPEMSAVEVGEVVRNALKDEYDFVVVNFANGDMVGHTGVFEAAVKAVETVDNEIFKILDVAKQKDYSVVITSDHGNCEQMRDVDGNILTNHTVGEVWCFVIDEDVKSVKSGGLSNIAPTVLKLMGLDIPKEMDEPLI